MRTEILEFRFPDGDYEVDATEHVPQVGEVVTRQGRVWKVEEIRPGIPPVAMLRPVPTAPTDREAT